MNHNEPGDRVDTTAIIVELLNEILQRLEGGNGDYAKRKTSRSPRNPNGTALIIVTLLLGILIGALIALLLSGCIEGGLGPFFGLGVVCGPAQIKLIKRDFYFLIVDKNNSIEPVEPFQARKVLAALGYQKIEEVKEHGEPVEIWQLPESRQTK